MPKPSAIATSGLPARAPPLVGVAVSHHRQEHLRYAPNYPTADGVEAALALLETGGDGLTDAPLTPLGCLRAKRDRVAGQVVDLTLYRRLGLSQLQRILRAWVPMRLGAAFLLVCTACPPQPEPARPVGQEAPPRCVTIEQSARNTRTLDEIERALVSSGAAEVRLSDDGCLRVRRGATEPGLVTFEVTFSDASGPAGVVVARFEFEHGPPRLPTGHLLLDGRFHPEEWLTGGLVTKAVWTVEAGQRRPRTFNRVDAATVSESGLGEGMATTWHWELQPDGGPFTRKVVLQEHSMSARPLERLGPAGGNEMFEAVLDAGGGSNEMRKAVEQLDRPGVSRDVFRAVDPHSPRPPYK
jgi:hypothetical protein